MCALPSVFRLLAQNVSVNGFETGQTRSGFFPGDFRRNNLTETIRRE
jgi:hypothetical protein